MATLFYDIPLVRLNSIDTALSLKENFVTLIAEFEPLAATPSRVFSIDIQRLSSELPLGTVFCQYLAQMFW